MYNTEFFDRPSWLDFQKRQSLQPAVVLLMMIVVVAGNDNTAAAAQLMIIITKYAKTNNGRIVTSYGKLFFRRRV